MRKNPGASPKIYMTSLSPILPQRNPGPFTRKLYIGEINSTKIQGSLTSVILLRVHWYIACKDVPSKVKDKLHLAFAKPQKRDNT